MNSADTLLNSRMYKIIRFREKLQSTFMEKGKRTFRNNAFNADHGANEFREKFPRRNTARNKRTFKTHKNLLPFLQVLLINATSSICCCIAERLHVLARVLQNPKPTQTSYSKKNKNKILDSLISFPKNK